MTTEGLIDERPIQVRQIQEGRCRDAVCVPAGLERGDDPHVEPPPATPWSVHARDQPGELDVALPDDRPDG